MLHKLILMILLVVPGLVVIPAEAWSADVTRSGLGEGQERQDTEAIKRIMKQGVYRAQDQDNKRFCSAFLDDFVEQRHITHTGPIVEAQDYNDPKMKKYLGRCPHAEFNKSVWMETLSQMRTCDAGVEPCGIPYHATRNFKLFKVNIDNNVKNGDEFVFYAEGYVNSVGKHTYGGYKLVDLRTCEVKAEVDTVDPYDYEENRSLPNYSGIIKYKGTYYIFQLTGSAGKKLELYK